MESNAIRLTNRTAIALRRQAKRTRNAYFVTGAAGTLLLLALAVRFNCAPQQPQQIFHTPPRLR